MDTQTLSIDEWRERLPFPISHARVAVWCQDERLKRPNKKPGAWKIGRDWRIHPDAIPPEDARKTRWKTHRSPTGSAGKSDSETV